MAPSVVSGSRPLLNAGGSHLAITEEPGEAIGPGDRHALSHRGRRTAGRTNIGRYMSCWMSSSRVHTTFTGPSTCLAISTARIDAVGLQPPAEAAADQMIVHHDLVQRQARGLRGRRLGARHGLAADPDFAAVLADMDRAVHRLHRGVREERNLVGRLDLGGGARQGLVDVADVLRDRARLERRLFELAHDRLRC